MRIKESWMLFKQHEIDELDQDDWEHYERGGCRCFAHSSRDCICGSWDVDLENIGMFSNEMYKGEGL
jgi:hypothetical protein